MVHDELWQACCQYVLLLVIPVRISLYLNGSLITDIFRDPDFWIFKDKEKENIYMYDDLLNANVCLKYLIFWGPYISINDVVSKATSFFHTGEE